MPVVLSEHLWDVQHIHTILIQLMSRRLDSRSLALHLTNVSWCARFLNVRSNAVFFPMASTNRRANPTHAGTQREWIPATCCICTSKKPNDAMALWFYESHASLKRSVEERNATQKQQRRRSECDVCLQAGDETSSNISSASMNRLKQAKRMREPKNTTARRMKVWRRSEWWWSSMRREKTTGASKHDQADYITTSQATFTSPTTYLNLKSFNSVSFMWF